MQAIHPLPTLLRRILTSCLALLIAIGLLVTATSPVFATQYIAWNDQGAGFATFNANEAITIDTGAMDYVTDCDEDGVNDFVYPFTTIYIVPSGQAEVGSRLYDVGGTPNPVGGTSSGAFLWAFLGVAGEKIPAGDYAVVYDECQNGIVDANDAVFDPAFRVVITTDAPPIDPAIQAMKTQAAEQAKHWARANIALKVAFFAAKQAEEIGMERASKLIKFLLEAKDRTLLGMDDPTDAALGNIVNTIGQYQAIADDPPDPHFQQLTTLAPISLTTVASADAVLQAAAQLGNTLAIEAAVREALLHAMERYQGADAAGNGDWALVQARAVQHYAMLLIDHLNATNASLTAMQSSLTQEAAELNQIAAENEAFRTDIASNGFSLTDRQTLRNLNFTNKAIISLKTAIVAQEFGNFSVAATQQQVATLIATNQQAITAYQQTVSKMEEIIAGLVAKSTVLNSHPQVAAGGPYTVSVGVPLALDGSRTSDADGPLTAQWDLDGDGRFTDASGLQTNYTFTHPFAGFVGLLVTDKYGWQGVAYARLTVTTSNQPPVISDAGPLDYLQELLPFTSLVFTATVSDPEGDTMVKQWSVDGNVKGTADEFTLNNNGNRNEMGLHIVQLRLSDGQHSVVRQWAVSLLATDGDSDGWRSNADCNDSEALINPSASEVVGNSLDDDCNPRTTDNGLALPPGLYTVTKLTDSNDGVCNDDCSLREAINSANLSDEQAITVVLGSGVYSLTLNGSAEDAGATGDLDSDIGMSRMLTIRGVGVSQSIIDAAGLQDQVLDSHSGAVTLVGVTIRNGDSTTAPFDSQSEIGFAGGIRSQNADLTLVDTAILSNTANWGGGGIAFLTNVRLQNLTIQRTQISYNQTRYIPFKSANGGGGIMVYSEGIPTHIAIVDSNISHNSADCGGGGLFTFTPYGLPNLQRVTLTKTLVTNNDARNATLNYCNGYGGGIFNASADLRIISSTINFNHADYGGGGIYNSLDRGSSWLIDSSVNHNLVEAAEGEPCVGGGGITNSFFNFNIINSFILKNVVECPSGDIGGYGGGIYGTANLTNSVVAHNRADIGAGVWYQNGVGTRTEIVHSTIHNNLGAGIEGYLQKDEISIENSLIAQNTAGNCKLGFSLGGKITSRGHNLSDDDSCFLTTSSDLTNTAPLLAKSVVNGVEESTHALTPASPAIDAASPGVCPTRDVRGVGRPQLLGCDIGAYQYQPQSQLRFRQTSYSVNESNATVTLTVERTGDTLGAVSVDYTTSDSSALAGSDYLTGTGTLTFTNGETSKTFTVTLKGDSDVEENERFVVSLSNTTGEVGLVAPGFVGVTIVDDDKAGNHIYLPIMMK